jgi:hypothetical protein
MIIPTDKDFTYEFDERVGIRHFEGEQTLNDAIRESLAELKAKYGDKPVTAWYHRHTSSNDLFALG